MVLDIIKSWYAKIDELCSPVQANSIRDTLMYNTLNVRQIILGSKVEEIADSVVQEVLGFEVLPKEVTYTKKNGKKKVGKADHVWRTTNEDVYVVEQKLRDNHDNTKKDGQVADFNAKVKAFRDLYPNKNVVGVFWFVDDTVKVSRKTLQKTLIENSTVRYGCEIFHDIDDGCLAFEKILNEIENRRNDDLVINFDTDPDLYFNDLVLSTDDNVFLEKFMTNEKVKKYVLPVISPEGIFSEKVKYYLGMII